MTRTVLITGGAGFIGTNLCRYWRGQYPEDRLVVLDKLTYAVDSANLEGLGLDFDTGLRSRGEPISVSTSCFRFEQGDITDEKVVRKIFQSEDIEIVIHLAAESHVDRSIENPAVFLDTNVKGTFILLQTSLDVSKNRCEKGRKGGSLRFVHVSTDEVFGSLEVSEPPFTESSPYRPNSPYAASKAAADHLVRAYHKTYALNTVITNCSNNYGPYQHSEKLVPLMIRNIARKRSLPVYGDGANIRDWIHVEDHCRGLAEVALKGEPGETYNIGAGNEQSNIDLVELICDMSDKALKRSTGESRKLIRFVKDRAGHDRRYAVDSSRIREKLNWKPERIFLKGLEETVEWYLSKMSHVD